MNWIDRYQTQMRRTRLLGVIGASLVVLSAVVEIYSTAFAVFVSETLLSDEVFLTSGDEVFLSPVAKDFLFVLSVGAVFIVRILVLLSRKEKPYYAHIASWIVALGVAVLAAYFWWRLPVYETCTPTEGNKICFGIYDIRRASWLEVSTGCYVWIGLLRSAFTALYALLNYRYK